MAWRPRNSPPHLPVTPQEIADDVTRCWEAGASVVAVHARRSDGLATCDPDVYSEINTLIRERTDIVINNSTGGGIHGDMPVRINDDLWELDWNERIKGIEGVGCEMATLDSHTITATFEGREHLVTTTPEALALAGRTDGRARDQARMGSIQPRAHPVGLHDADSRGPGHRTVLLQHRARRAPRLSGWPAVHPEDPADARRTPARGHGVGGCLGHRTDTTARHHARPAARRTHAVGLEDNLYYSHGRLATNLELVERAVRIITELGYELATPAEARDILGLKQLDTVPA